MKTDTVFPFYRHLRDPRSVVFFRKESDDRPSGFANLDLPIPSFALRDLLAYMCHKGRRGVTQEISVSYYSR